MGNKYPSEKREDRAEKRAAKRDAVDEAVEDAIEALQEDKEPACPRCGFRGGAHWCAGRQ